MKNLMQTFPVEREVVPQVLIGILRSKEFGDLCSLNFPQAFDFALSILPSLGFDKEGVYPTYKHQFQGVRIHFPYPKLWGVNLEYEGIGDFKRVSWREDTWIDKGMSGEWESCIQASEGRDSNGFLKYGQPVAIEGQDYGTTLFRVCETYVRSLEYREVLGPNEYLLID